MVNGFTQKYFSKWLPLLNWRDFIAEISSSVFHTNVMAKGNFGCIYIKNICLTYHVQHMDDSLGHIRGGQKLKCSSNFRQIFNLLQSIGSLYSNEK